MNDPNDLLSPQRLRTLHIVAGALLMSPLIFLGIVLYMVLVQNKGAGAAPPAGLPLLSIMAFVFFAIVAPLAYFVPSFLTRSAVRQIASGSWKAPPGAKAADFGSDASKLLGVQQSSMIVGLALLEGSAFFACIAYLMEARTFALSIVLTDVVLMLMKFPTEGQVRSWLTAQTEQLDELRRRGDPAAGR